MTTRKIIIENEYLRLCQKITNIMDKQIMPDLNNYQLSDIIFILVQHFSDVSNEYYKKKLFHYRFRYITKY